MKIAISMSLLTWGAGAQKVVVGLANYLNDHGHEVTILGFEPQDPKGSKTFYPVNKDVNIETIIRPTSTFKENLSKVISSRLLEPTLRDEIIWYDHYIPVLRQIKNALQKSKPDIVVGVLPSTFTYLATVLEGSTLPLVIGNQNDPSQDYSAINRFSSNTFDSKRRNLAPNLGIANVVLLEKYKEYFAKNVQKKTYVIPNPLDIMPSTEVLGSKREPIVLSVGRLEAVKNHDMLIKSFAKIAKTNPEWQLHIYGEGSLKSDLQNLIKKLGVGSRIFLKGQTKNIHSKYKQASIYAQPSHFEGLSLAMLEAMAYGLPAVVIEECTSNNFLITQSKGGLVSKNTESGIAGNLDKLIKDEKLREELGANSRKYAANFEQHKVFKQWEELLLKLSAHHRQPTAKDYDQLNERLANLESHFNDLLIKVIKEQKAEIDRQKELYKKKKQEVHNIQNSRSYKLGRAILAPARKVKKT